MKIWFKLLLGLVLGIALGIFIPVGGTVAQLFTFLGKLSLHFGRYLVLPLMFFALVMATHEMHLQRRFLRAIGLMLAYGALTTAGMMVVGILGMWVLSPSRIPIIATQPFTLNVPSWRDLLLRVFPLNGFTVFAEGGDFSLPLLFFGVLVGLNLAFDRQVARSITDFSDSLNKVFWHLNVFATEFLYVPVIFLASSLVLALRKGSDIKIFLPFVLLLGGLTLVIAFVGFPVAYYFIHGKEKPFRWMYAQWGPGIAALVSGDVLFAYGQLARHGNEALGVPRRIGALVSPFLLVFSRGGSAFVSLITFLVLFRSYSSLGLGLFETLWVILMGVLISLSLGAFPGMGAFAGVVLMGQLFGRGMEEGYVILSPVVPLIVSCGALLDLLCASFVSHLVAKRLGCLRADEYLHSI